MFIIVKEAVYEHGVFFMTEDLDCALTKVVEYAANDRDSHHNWVVYEHTNIPVEKSSDDAEYRFICSITKRDKSVSFKDTRI